MTDVPEAEGCQSFSVASSPTLPNKAPLLFPSMKREGCRFPQLTPVLSRIAEYP
jgi:hypothetical protein